MAGQTDTCVSAVALGATQVTAAGFPIPSEAALAALHSVPTNLGVWFKVVLVIAPVNKKITPFTICICEPRGSNLVTADHLRKSTAEGQVWRAAGPAPSTHRVPWTYAGQIRMNSGV